MKYLKYVFCVLIVVSCSDFGNPHYLNNSAVKEISRQYSFDSSKFILTYQLDVGARGIRYYQTILNKNQEKGALDKYLIPWQLSKLKWIDNNNIEAKFDNEADGKYGATYTELDITKEKVEINHVLFHINRNEN